jgi:hypothetical protein
MKSSSQDTTARELLAAYDRAVGLGSAEGRTEELTRLREAFQKRTGAFRPEDAWFEARSRAFWDDAVAGGFGADELDGAVARRLRQAHRGLFVVSHDEGDAHLVDLWSGAELIVSYLDEAQGVDFDNAEGLVDARVVAGDDQGALFVLPGAFHHAADATEPARRVLDAARDRGMGTTEALDTLLKMELVFRTSSRVKAAFAYRVESLPRA